ncbi:MAG: hypothetical protein M3362_00840 [Acidobacteriota bacterium]|nr:hypothetical protein [Acidobacteriota bacterium]
MMVHPSVFGCADPLRREQGFSDTYDRAEPIPRSSHQERIQLPSFIPGVKSGLNLEMCNHMPLWAISLGDIVGVNGDLLVESVDEIKRRCRLPQEARLALICTAKDAQLNALWKVSYKKNIWRRIAEMGFEWVTSLSFSVWDEYPRTDQILSQDKNFLTHDYFANLGLPSIPFVYPFDDWDYRAFGEWIEERPDIDKLAVLAQFYSTDAHFVQFRRNMRKIQEHARRSIKFLVVSAAKRSKVASVMSEFDATIVNWKPFHKALAGNVCDDSLEYEFDPAPREELAFISFERHLRYCDLLHALRQRAA